MSHARSHLIAVALLLSSAAHAVAEPAVVQRKLNLRSGPGPAFATLAVLPPGARFDAQKCSGEWCHVRFGRQAGYVSREFIKTGADSFASAAPHSAPEHLKPTLGGPHVWQWNDSAWRDRHWRRLEWHNRMNQR
jgi:uncharacterized protein YraI